MKKNKKNIENETIENTDENNTAENTASDNQAEQNNADEKLSDEQKQINELQEKYDKEHELLLRTAAEYENFRKRSITEKQSAYTLAKVEAVAALLPVADNLERALAAAADDSSDLKKGVEMTLQQLNDCFAAIGVEAIKAEPGDPFDPELHNAVMHVENAEMEQNVIVQCFQKGYKLGDKIIRHSMVQVAN